MYAKAAEAEKKNLNPRLKDLAIELGFPGYYYYEVGQYDKAINHSTRKAVRKKEEIL